MTTTAIALSELIQPGNVAVITGASSGIGRAAAVRWAAAGMHVWMLDDDEPELHEKAVPLAQAKGGSGTVRGVTADVSNEVALLAVADRVFAAHGTVHVLLNNAGVGLGGGPLTDTATVSKALNVNLYGPIHGCLAFVPRMKQAGQAGIVINTGVCMGVKRTP